MPETASAVDKADRAGGLARLEDRAVVRVSGPEAGHFLQGILTQDVEELGPGAAAFAALLSAQGKILFDFFVVRVSDGFLLDTAGGMAADLIKRLTLYRLRAKVQFADVTGERQVFVAWGAAASRPDAFADAIVFPDPRLPALGLRILAPTGRAMGAIGSTAADWHAVRVHLGVPEGGKDFPYGDAFPHEADMDQLAGVSFSKGCYIGQEVVSRMQHRAMARKRIVPVRGEGPLASGSALTAGEATIGSMGSVAGREGLALVRLDRAAEAKAKGIALKAGDVAIALRKPEWARFELEPAAIARDLA